jgi:hypothetical protein
MGRASFSFERHMFVIAPSFLVHGSGVVSADPVWYGCWGRVLQPFSEDDPSDRRENGCQWSHRKSPTASFAGCLMVRARPVPGPSIT